MDSLAVRAVVAELSSYRGFRLQGVSMVDPWEMRLRLERQATVVLCVQPGHNALFVAPEGDDPEGSGGASFARSVGSTLAGTRLSGAEQAGLDRVVALAFRRRDRLGDPVTVHLVAELIGQGGNLILLDGDSAWEGRIRDRLRPDRSRRCPRRLQPGVWYAPPRSEKPDAARATREELLKSLERVLRKGETGPPTLVQAWSGVSPDSAREVWTDDADPRALLERWEAFRLDTEPPRGDESAGRRFAPTVVTSAGGLGRALPFLPHHEQAETRSFPTMSAAVASAHADFRARRPREMTSPLHRAVQQAIRRTERARDRHGQESEDSKDPRTLRRMGEALLAAAHTVEAGATEARVPDPETGESIHLRLNPKLSPGGNAELFFKRARKEERRAGRKDTRRAELGRTRAGLEDLARRLADSVGEPDPAWFEQARRLGVKLPPDAGTRHRPPEERLPAAVRPRRYDLGGGWEALVGKSRRGNDVLTHEIARPHETWMHADQAAGSHLVLRHSEKGKQPPESILLAAAGIAAFFSKARHSAKVPVLITEKRYVRRPRKGPLGTALVGKHRTVMVRPTEPHAKEEDR